MALMDQQGSGLYNQDPQQNQTLTGNPATDPNAQTSWMSPSRTMTPDPGFQNTGINGGAQPPNFQNQNTPISDGTMLGQITAGNVSQQAPPGFDQGKWADPNKHDPKYDVGRILSKYPPNTQGLQAAMSELSPLGYKMTGKDTIVGPDGIPVDVGFAFGSGSGSHWQWNPNDPNSSNSQQNQGSYLGQNNDPYAQNNMLNQMFQQLQAQRQMYANQPFNPTGGQLQFPMGQANASQQINPMMSTQPQIGSMLNPITQQPLPISVWHPMGPNSQGAV